MPKCELCMKTASFGVPGERATRCGRCKGYGYVSVVGKKCEHEQCLKRSNFGLPGEKPKFCKTHCKVGMINLKCLKCTFDNCTKTAQFGPLGGKILACSSHKEPDYIHKNACKICHVGRGRFGVSKQGATHCIKCKAKLVGNVIDFRKYCEVSGCCKWASFGKVETTVVMTRCKTHADGDKDLVDLKSLHKYFGTGPPPEKKRKAIFV